MHIVEDNHHFRILKIRNLFMIKKSKYTANEIVIFIRLLYYNIE